MISTKSMAASLLAGCVACCACGGAAGAVLAGAPGGVGETGDARAPGGAELLMTTPTNEAALHELAGPGGVVDPEFLDQWAATNRFRLGQPGSFRVLPNGSGVLFLRAAGPRSFVQDLWLLDVANGTERVLLTAEQVLAGGKEVLTAEEQARRERMRMTSRGISAYHVNEDGTKILVPLSGRLFVIDLEGGGASRVREIKGEAGGAGGGGFPIDPTFSSDGTLIACVRKGEVYVTDVATLAERRVTTGAGGTVTNGLAEFVAQEEMSRFRGYWISPDSKTLCFQQTDTAGMEMFHIADPLEPSTQPNVSAYPRAGKANAKVKLGLQPLGAGTAAAGASTGDSVVWVQWDSAKYPYLATVVWGKGGPLTILVQNRKQTEQVLLAVDEKTGATRELLKETDAAWIDLAHSCPKWLPDGSGFLWMTQQDATGDDGWRLELRGPDGSVRREIVSGSAGLLDGIDLVDDGRAVQVALSPTAVGTQVWRYPLDGAPGAAPLMVAGPSAKDHAGDHGVSGAKKSSVWVHTYSLLDGRNGWDVMQGLGVGAKKIASLKSIAEEPARLPRVELMTLGEEMDMRVAVVKPRDFDPSKKYPLINYVYGGPGSNQVGAGGRGYLLHQWMADQGYIVMSADGRGTPRRGRAWERAIKNDVIAIPLDDQARAVAAVSRRLGCVRPGPVGIVGWSFGGYFSAHAVMRRPDVFGAGVAGAPVCDWRDYDTHYTERYMGLPDENTSGYEATNVVTYCKDLRVPLLIIHGTADDNVYFLHALKMVRELFLNGRDFEFLPLAGYTHVVPSPQVTRNMWTRVALFFNKSLRDASAR